MKKFEVGKTYHMDYKAHTYNPNKPIYLHCLYRVVSRTGNTITVEPANGDARWIFGNKELYREATDTYERPDCEALQIIDWNYIYAA